MSEHLGFLKAAGCCPEHMKRQLLGQAPINEVALAEMIAARKAKSGKKTAADSAVYHRNRRISTGKVPTTQLDDLKDLRSMLITQERRMGREGGKGNVVSAKKVWRKYTDKGGRTEDIRQSIARQLTHHVPAGDPEGVKTVQFKSPAKKPASSKATAKPKAKKPTKK